MSGRGKEARLTKTIERLPKEEKFFAIALYFLDSVLAAFAWKASGLAQIVLLSMFIFVLLVIVILVWWMRVDQNRRIHDRKVTESAKFAESLADDVCEMYEGSMRNEKANKRATEKEIRSGYELLFDGVSNRTLSQAESCFVEVFVRKIKVNADHRRKLAQSENISNDHQKA